MTFRQAIELNAHVRKGEKGSLVVYANAITRTERDDETGEDVEREIPYMKGYTVFNVEQIDGLPDIYYAKADPKLDPVARIDARPKNSSPPATPPPPRRQSRLLRAGTRLRSDAAHSSASATPRATTPRSRMNSRIGPSTLPACTATSAARVGRRGLRAGGTRRRAGLCVPVRRSRTRARAARGSRRLYRQLAGSAAQRQALRRASRVIRTESR